MKKLLLGATALPSRPADVALLLFRLHLGLSIALGAGWGKLSTLTGVGGPPDWFVQQVAGLGFTQPSPYLWAWLACWGELVGGLLLALGLLTRLSALQLAFQFFVIAFLWYDKPEFLVGMYYQQLFFWAFVLVTVVGGGRYSLDYWLLQRSGSARTTARLAGTASAQVVAVLLCVVAGSVAAQPPVVPAKVAMQELKAIAQQWDGSLTYLDYTTKKPVTLVTILNGMQSGPQELVLDFIYQEPEGGQVKGYDKVRLSADGTRIIWDGTPLQISRKTHPPDQTLELVLEGRGLDDNKKCFIKRTIVLGTCQFSVLKEVKYDGALAFITRNKYQFQR
ncbi:MAG: DoxX family membrane protein [Hymenobacter sp.]|nr:DoxX family membrane protein [Hymenobacter sp.]